MNELTDAVARILGEPVPSLTDLERLGEWLAARGIGLIPVDAPGEFSWPGHWIAITAAGRAVVMFGVPSGPLDGDLPDGDPVERGYVLAPHDLRMERRGERASGVVDTLVVAPATAGPARCEERCRAIAGRGLEGDRYASGGGTFAADGRIGQDLTLIEAEDLAAAGISAVEARRNIVTRGVDLDLLIGRRFRIGEVLCQGQRRAEPCAHLQRLIRPGALRSLVHRGGIRADILAGGTIVTGDAVRLSE